MRTKFVIGACLAAALAAGVAMGADTRALIGASRDQILARFGEPKSQIVAGNREVLLFATERVVLRDNRAIEIEDLPAEPPPAPPVQPSPPPPAAAADSTPSDSTSDATAAQKTATSPSTDRNKANAPSNGGGAASDQTASANAPTVSTPSTPELVIKSVRPPSRSVSPAVAPAAPTVSKGDTNAAASSAEPAPAPAVSAPAQTSVANSTPTPTPTVPPATPVAPAPGNASIAAAPAPSASASTIAPSATATPPPVASSATPDDSAAAAATPQADVSSAPAPAATITTSTASASPASTTAAASPKPVAPTPLPSALDRSTTVGSRRFAAVALVIIVAGIGYLYWSRRRRAAMLAATAVSRSPFSSLATAPTSGAVGRFTSDLLDKLEWRRFEELVAAYYNKTGVVATRTNTGPMAPVHIRISWKGEQRPFACVQCHAHPPGLIEARQVQALVDALAAEDIRRGYVVTSGKFGVPARDLAEEKHITLLSGDLFLEKLNALPEPARAELLRDASAGDYTTPTCPTCESKMSRSLGEASWTCPQCGTTLPRG